MREETFAEKISRLEMMSDPQDTKWDLSDKDRAAIRALLDQYRDCGTSLKTIFTVLSGAA